MSNNAHVSDKKFIHRVLYELVKAAVFRPTIMLKIDGRRRLAKDKNCNNTVLDNLQNYRYQALYYK